MSSAKAPVSDSARNEPGPLPELEPPVPQLEEYWTEQPWGAGWTFQCSFCPYAHEDPAVIADHVRGVHGVTL